jgi:hypothetical protein
VPGSCPRLRPDRRQKKSQYVGVFKATNTVFFKKGPSPEELLMVRKGEPLTQPEN